MVIRELTEGDIPEVYRIECENFSQPWTRAALLGEVASDRSHYLVAEKEGKIAGYIGFWKIFDEGHITNIAVDKTCQNQGIGSGLIKEMLAMGESLEVDQFTLEVRVSNAPAIALYSKFGFEEAGRRKGFYDGPKEDALIMWCSR